MDKQRTFRVSEVFAGILTLGVLGYMLNLVFLQIEDICSAGVARRRGIADKESIRCRQRKPRTLLPMDMPEMLRLATIPAVQLLAETRSALLLVDVQNRFIFGASEASPRRRRACCSRSKRCCGPRAAATSRASTSRSRIRRVRMPRHGCGGSTTWART